MDTHTSVKNVKTASGINIAAGVWLIAAPFVLAFAELPDALWNHIIVGLIVLVLAAIRASSPMQNPWMSWANAILGVWMIASPFVMELTETAMWNSIITGLVVTAMAVWSASATHSATRARVRA